MFSDFGDLQPFHNERISPFIGGLLKNGNEDDIQKQHRIYANNDTTTQELTQEQYQRLQPKIICEYIEMLDEKNAYECYIKCEHILWNSRIYRIEHKKAYKKDGEFNRIFIVRKPLEVSDQWTRKFDSKGFKRSEIPEKTYEGYDMFTYTKDEMQHIGFMLDGVEYVSKRNRLII